MGKIGRRRLNSSTMVFSSRSLLTSLFLRVLYNQRIAVNFSVKLFSAVQLNEFFKAVGNHGWIYIREKKWVMEEIGCSRKWKWNLESNWVIVSFKLFRERVKIYVLPLDRIISLSKKSRVSNVLKPDSWLACLGTCSTVMSTMIQACALYFDAFYILSAACGNSWYSAAESGVVW